jgi:hypothetical protein
MKARDIVAYSAQQLELYFVVSIGIDCAMIKQVDSDAAKPFLVPKSTLTIWESFPTTSPPGFYITDDDWRLPKRGEWIKTSSGRVIKVKHDYVSLRYWILKPIEKPIEKPIVNEVEPPTKKRWIVLVDHETEPKFVITSEEEASKVLSCWQVSDLTTRK